MLSLTRALRFPELRIAVRRLRRAPTFVVATVAVLGLSIGATTAVFSVVNGVLLRPLPYPYPDQLVSLTHTAQVDGLTSVDQSAGGLLYYQEHARAFQASGGWRDRDVNVSRPPEDPGPPERISAAMVTANLFDVLGVRPALGRSFRAGEDRPGAAPEVVLSERLWRRYFRGDRSAIGHRLEIDGISREIIGVMPADFTFIKSAPELWYPITINPATANIGDFNYRSVARLRPHETRESARKDLAQILPHMVDEFPTGVPRAMWERAHAQPVVTSLRDYVVGDAAEFLWILFGSVSLVLGIACANVASLLLVRAEGRRLELAVRGALGSGVAGMMATTLSESLVLSAAGAVCGIAVAEIAVGLARAGAATAAIPRLDHLTVDIRVFAFGLAVAAVCAVLVGAIPMLRARRIAVGTVLREAGRSGTAGAARQRARNTLVIAQIALSMVLVTASALLARSFARLRDVQPGFRADGVIAMRLVLPSAKYPTRRSVALMQLQLLEAVRAVPGVHAASLTDWVALTDDRTSAVITVEDHPVAPGTIPGVHSTVTVEGSYFATMGIPVRAGRTLTPMDPEHPAREAVVSHAFAERFWPHGSPLGKRIHPNIAGPWLTIVGEVGDAHYEALDRPSNDAVYLPLVTGDSDVNVSTPRQVALVIDAGTQAASISAAVRTAVRALDPALPLFDEHTMSDIVSAATARARVTLTLLICASTVALILGAVGVYGVISYAVTMRHREIGVRIALGATPRTVSRMIAREGARLGFAGVLIGLILAIGVTRLLRGLLFEISPRDPSTLAGTCFILLVIALVASWAPAQRAAAVDPAEALRQ